MSGKHLFIARHHRLALAQRPADNPIAGISVVNKLDNEIDLRILKYIVGIVGHVNLAVTMLGNVAHTDSAQFHICRTGIFKQLIETAPNCAEAKQPYT